MISAASPRGMPRRWREAEGGDAVDDAEVDHLGGAAHLGVTSSSATPKTRAAVAGWMSRSCSKASIMPGSPDMAAMTRSSICE